MREAARIGRAVDRRSEKGEEPATPLMAVTKAGPVEDHEAATFRSDDSADVSDEPPVTLTTGPIRPSSLEGVVNALGWLAPKQRTRWLHGHVSIRCL